jgi:hypothetical protein
MTTALGGLLLVVFLLMTLYVDCEISFNRSENGEFSFRFEIGMKKS